MFRLLIFIFFFSSVQSLAQVKLYEDQFFGGVTGGSFSSGVSGSGSGVITVHVDSFSTIRKAYLIAGRLGPSVPCTVTLDTLTLTLDNSNEATPTFTTSLYGGASAVHAIDITSRISPLVSNYTISYSQAGSGANFFTDFYLYIAYENNTMALVNTVVFLKTLDFMPTENYTLNLTYPLDTLVPIGFAMHAGYMCNINSDAENITIISTLLGAIGGGDPNDPPNTCAGTSGAFYYENDTLFGLVGDDPNQGMSNNDALSDISMIVPNGSTSFDVQFEHFGGPGSSPDNSMWAWIMAYGVSNLQPMALFSSPNHICPGTCTEFINNSLNASSFQWIFPGATPSVSTDENPVGICYNTPGQYDVTLIANNSNGSDTLTLANYITVYAYPPAQGIVQAGDTLYANPGAVSYQWFQDGSLIPGATDYYYVANSGGNFNVVATDVNGCEVEAAIFDVIASVHDAGAPLTFSVYPNPADVLLHIASPSPVSVIRLLDLLGVRHEVPIIQSEGGRNCDLNVEALASGIYWIEIEGPQLSRRLKFIKHNKQ